MLTKNDIANAQNGDFSSFFEAVKKTLEEKLDNNSFIKNSMSKIEYYKNLTNTLGSISESECEDDEDDEDKDDELDSEKDSEKDEDEDSEKDEDSDESDDEDDDDEDEDDD